LGAGMVDFAGWVLAFSAAKSTRLLEVWLTWLCRSAVVHTTGGMTALIATKVLGPRTGRFTDLRGRVLATPKGFTGHSLALQMLGVSCLSMLFV
jgi:Amt family ammonium transporter